MGCHGCSGLWLGHHVTCGRRRGTGAAPAERLTGLHVEGSEGADHPEDEENEPCHNPQAAAQVSVPGLHNQGNMPLAPKRQHGPQGL